MLPLMSRHTGASPRSWMHVLPALLAVVALAVAGCTSAFDESSMTVRFNYGQVELLAGDTVISGGGPARKGTNRVFVATYDGDTGTRLNFFFYGIASPEIERVVLTHTTVAWSGGIVRDGVWLISAPDKGVELGDFRYQFLDRSGSVVEHGIGITPISDAPPPTPSPSSVP